MFSTLGRRKNGNEPIKENVDNREEGHDTGIAKVESMGGGVGGWLRFQFSLLLEDGNLRLG